MPLYQINGYDVEFPHEAYECQVGVDCAANSLSSSDLTAPAHSALASTQHLAATLLDVILQFHTHPVE